MSNEPVDMEGPDELEEQQEQTQHQTSEPKLIFRIKPHEVPFYQRMADYFWRSGLIKEPSLHMLARACLNIVANRWAKLEEQNYNAYVSKRLREARADARMIPGREMYNPRAKIHTPFDETNFPDQYQSDQTMYRQPPKIPPQLRRDPPIEKIDVDFW